MDIGGTNIRFGIIDGRGKVIARYRMPTLKEQGKYKVIRRLLDAAAGLIKRSGVKVKAIGAGCPGPLDSKKGEILSPPNLPDWRGVRLKKIIERRFRVPVVVENDANCAGLGESVRGAGRRASSMVLLTLGTGIGSAIVLDGKLWTGKGGFASELGHVSIDIKGPKCGCGNRGCLEMYASATAVVRRMKKAEMTAEQTYGAARKGDKLARKIVDETAVYLGAAVANIINALDPEVIVLAGGMAKAGKKYFAKIRKAAKERALKESFKGVRIVPAELGEDAGIIGAAWRAKKQ
ncbi:MAG: ROK family protein [Candidatus Omnitrophica bacterium]|nr:ROK family protein [Candidatus Omnitrophota bacterium]MDD5310979.1 ROK family protein [Candidatus Omnitrophota bacterium]MDD5546326.1 ROK family protein [Candidatus Omnitrophota bacterium]